MIRNTSILAMAATAVLSLAATGSATAQTAPAASPVRLDTITVVAPRITYEQQRRTGGSALPTRVEVAKQTAVVDASDLDLSRTADLFTLETRINEAAQRVCNELAKLYPDGEPATDVCVRRANDDAMAQVHATARRLAGR